MTAQNLGRLQIIAGLIVLASLGFLFSGQAPKISKVRPPQTLTVLAMPADARVTLAPTPGDKIQMAANQPIDLDRLFSNGVEPEQLIVRIEREGFKPYEQTFRGLDVGLLRTWDTFPKDGSVIALEEGETSYLALKLARRWPVIPLALLGLVGVIVASRRKAATANRLRRLAQLAESRLEYPYSGTLIGEYRITEFIGEGGMADVYKLAPDRLLGTPGESKELLAIKICKNIDPEWQQRFFQELAVSQEIDHPNALKIFKSGHFQNEEPKPGAQKGEDLQRPYLIMEYLEGRTIYQLTTTETVVKQGDREEIQTQHHILPASRIVEYLAPAVEALQYAHDKGIVHRDVTPKNILIAKSGATKLLDFGLSKILANKHLMLTTTAFGTPDYLSPEQLLDNAEVDVRTDQFALGALIYQLLTGTVPHGVDRGNVLNKLLNYQEVIPIHQVSPDCDPEVAKVVEKMLRPKREERYSSVKEAFEAFVAAAKD